MKLNAYSVFDQASGLYCRPFFAQSDGEAVRQFSDLALDADHPVGKHAADYTLFRLGIFDDNSGLLTNEDNSNLGNALAIASNAQTVNKDNLDMFDQSLVKDPEQKEHDRQLAVAQKCGSDPRETTGENI